MIWASYFLALLGFLKLLTYRPKNAATPIEMTSISLPRLSIIVPARNEARTLPHLLRSLGQLRNLETEVIVVDDHSSDRTADIARAWGAQVIEAPELPSGWSGKNWACWQGAKRATGEYLLFTDADTELESERLRTVLAYAEKNGRDLISSVPFHITESLWEKSLGAFQYFVLLASSAFSQPRPKALFAIGQFLLFRSESYFAIGGHEAIRSAPVDDIHLAQAILAKGKSYEVSQAPLYRVRMYESFREFVAGWRRNFTWGFQLSDSTGTVRIILSFFALTGGGQFFDNLFSTGLCLGSWCIVFVRQRRYGEYPLWSFLTLPIALVVFCLVSALAAVDSMTKRPVKWKGRSYPQRD